MKKVFMGGTQNGSKWREALIPLLKIAYTEDRAEKTACDLELYVLTPLETGFVSFAEAAGAAATRRDSSVIVCFLPDDDGTAEFTSRPRDAVVATWMPDQIASMEQMGQMVIGLGARVVGPSITAIADELNQYFAEIPYRPDVVQCLIERDGPTQMWMQRTEYNFVANELGDYVCEVHNRDHLARFLSMETFRIYQPGKRPPSEFTDEEHAFLAQWQTKPELDFYAYVNGNIDKFANASPKVQATAIAKWARFQTPKPPSTRMQCPIVLNVPERPPVPAPEPELLPPAPPIEPPKAVEPEIVQRPEYRSWTDDQWETWAQSWIRLPAVHFSKLLADAETQQMLLFSPESVYERAEQKWKKLIPDTPFPIEEEE